MNGRQKRGFWWDDVALHPCPAQLGTTMELLLTWTNKHFSQNKWVLNWILADDPDKPEKYNAEISLYLIIWAQNSYN